MPHVGVVVVEGLGQGGGLVGGADVADRGDRGGPRVGVGGGAGHLGERRGEAGGGLAAIADHLRRRGLQILVVAAERLEEDRPGTRRLPAEAREGPHGRHAHERIGVAEQRGRGVAGGGAGLGTEFAERRDGRLTRLGIVRAEHADERRRGLDRPRADLTQGVDDADQDVAVLLGGQRPHEGTGGAGGIRADGGQRADGAAAHHRVAVGQRAGEEGRGVAGVGADPGQRRRGRRAHQQCLVAEQAAQFARGRAGLGPDGRQCRRGPLPLQGRLRAEKPGHGRHRRLRRRTVVGDRHQHAGARLGVGRAGRRPREGVDRVVDGVVVIHRSDRTQRRGGRAHERRVVGPEEGDEGAGRGGEIGAVVVRRAVGRVAVGDRGDREGRHEAAPRVGLGERRHELRQRGGGVGLGEPAEFGDLRIASLPRGAQRGQGAGEQQQRDRNGEPERNLHRWCPPWWECEWCE